MLTTGQTISNNWLNSIVPFSEKDKLDNNCYSLFNVEQCNYLKLRRNNLKSELINDVGNEIRNEAKQKFLNEVRKQMIYELSNRVFNLCKRIDTEEHIEI